jgi:RNase adaptor protein for sRNA GlmZ degradation
MASTIERFIDPNTGMELDCREYIPTKKARESSQVLYKELLDSLYPQYLKELRSLTTLYIRGGLSPDEKD